MALDFHWQSWLTKKKMITSAQRASMADGYSNFVFSMALPFPSRVGKTFPSPSMEDVL
jgi:hypothetical protein